MVSKIVTGIRKYKTTSYFPNISKLYDELFPTSFSAKSSIEVN